jgi:hypothetical protein
VGNQHERLEEPPRVRAMLVGLASGIDWTVWSSAESGAARASVRFRAAR